MLFALEEMNGIVIASVNEFKIVSVIVSVSMNASEIHVHVIA